jgi:hypothetical protein
MQSILYLNKISCSRDGVSSVCDACQLAKSHQLLYASSVHHSSSPLELIFFDVWGSVPCSIGGYKYYISFLDNFSKFFWIYLMHERTEAPRIFCNLKVMLSVFLTPPSSVSNLIGEGNTKKCIIHFLNLLASLIMFHVHTHQ